MISRHTVSARRRRRSSGNSWVEWSLTFLPMFALFCFFFDVVFAMFSWNTLQNAVREGTRYAITFQTETGEGQDTSIEQVVENYSMGLITSSNASLMQVNFYAPNAPNTPIAYPGGNIPGNLVQVSVQGYSLTWLFPLTGTLANPFRSPTPASISVYSEDVMGGYPAGTTSVAR